MKKELLIIQPPHYNEAVMTEITEISQHTRAICYVSLNKMYKTIRRLFEQHGIATGKFVFIDSAYWDRPKPQASSAPVYFTENPGSMQAGGSLLSTIREVVVKNHTDTLILDSLSSLTIYLTEENALRWLDSLLAFMEEENVQIFLLALAGDARESKVIKQTEMRVDRTRLCK